MILLDTDDLVKRIKFTDLSNVLIPRDCFLEKEQTDFFSFIPVFLDQTLNDKMSDLTIGQILEIYVNCRNYIKLLNDNGYSGFLFQNVIYKNGTFIPYILNSKIYYLGDHLYNYFYEKNDDDYVDASSLEFPDFESIDYETGIIYYQSAYYSLALLIARLISKDRDVCKNIKKFNTNELMESERFKGEIYKNLVRFCKEATVFNVNERACIGSEIDTILMKLYVKQPLYFYINKVKENINYETVAGSNFYNFIMNKSLFLRLTSESDKDILLSDVVNFLDFANRYQYVCNNYEEYEEICGELLLNIFIGKNVNNTSNLYYRVDNPFWGIRGTKELYELFRSMCLLKPDIYFSKYKKFNISNRPKENERIMNMSFIYIFYQLFAKLTLDV